MVKTLNIFLLDYKQWGVILATGSPYPWKFIYPVILKNNLFGVSVTRLSGAGCYSEIVQERTLSYLTWIDKDYTNTTGGGDLINFIILGN